MAVTGTSLSSKKVSKNVPGALASAFLEWLLIFFLFVDAIFSYLITKFARYSGLQVPCLICSRLDHVLGNEKEKNYQDLICHSHRLEISSLVLCRMHNKLVDVHEICESCLFSFATINKSNAEAYRLLVGKLGPDPHVEHKHDSCLEEQIIGSSDKKNCSCCSEQYIAGGHAQKLLRTKSIGFGSVEFGLPLTVSTGHNFDDIEEIRDEPSRSLTVSHGRKTEVDHLSHIGYKQVKITSDTESEVPFSDDDDNAGSLIRKTNGPKEGISVPYVHQEPRIITLADDDDDDAIALIHKTDGPEEGFSVPCVDEKPRIITLVDDDDTATALVRETYVVEERFAVPSVDEEPRVITVADDGEDASALTHKTSGHEEGFSVPSLDQEPCIVTPADDLTSETLILPASAPELLDNESEVELNAVNPNGFVSEVSSGPPVGHGLEELNWHQVEQKSEPLVISELMTFDEVPPSSTLMDTPEVQQENLNASVTTEGGQDSVTENGDILKLRSGSITPSETGVESNSVAMPLTNNLELGDAYKIAVGNRGRQLSGKFSEQLSMKESSKLSEDLKLLMSQLSSTRGTEFPMADMSPRVSGNIDELKTSDASGIGMQIFQRRMSLERNESGLSVDGSLVSEIEGESTVERLKRQIEHDMKLMAALYKELEEERNASAIAVNQAMAMITRLQEEKATLQMEALQCLRMMEEQAEYDVEALNKANDLISEKDKEIQDLEAELEIYRIKYGEISMFEKVVEIVDANLRSEQPDPNNVDDSSTVFTQSSY